MPHRKPISVHAVRRILRVTNQVRVAVPTTAFLLIFFGLPFLWFYFGLDKYSWGMPVWVIVYLAVIAVSVVIFHATGEVSKRILRNWHHIIGVPSSVVPIASNGKRFVDLDGNWTISESMSPDAWLVEMRDFPGRTLLPYESDSVGFMRKAGSGAASIDFYRRRLKRRERREGIDPHYTGSWYFGGPIV